MDVSNNLTKVCTEDLGSLAVLWLSDSKSPSNSVEIGAPMIGKVCADALGIQPLAFISNVVMVHDDALV